MSLMHFSGTDHRGLIHFIDKLHSIVVCIPFGRPLRAERILGRAINLQHLIVVIQDNLDADDAFSELLPLLSVPTVAGCKRLTVITSSQYVKAVGVKARNAPWFNDSDPIEYKEAGDVPISIESVFYGYSEIERLLLEDDAIVFSQLRQLVLYSDEDPEDALAHAHRACHIQRIPYMALIGPSSPSIADMLLFEQQLPPEPFESKVSGAHVLIGRDSKALDMNASAVDFITAMPVWNNLQYIMADQSYALSNACSNRHAVVPGTRINWTWFHGPGQGLSERFRRANVRIGRDYPFQAMCWMSLRAVNANRHHMLRDSVLSDELLKPIFAFAFGSRDDLRAHDLHISVSAEMQEHLERAVVPLDGIRVRNLFNTRFARAVGYQNTQPRAPKRHIEVIEIE